jgi:hypothetical protein
MLSFPLGHKLENELRVLQGKIVETYKVIEDLPPEEAKFLHRFALISNIGACTMICFDTILRLDIVPAGTKNPLTGSFLSITKPASGERSWTPLHRDG